VVTDTRPPSAGGAPQRPGQASPPGGPRDAGNSTVETAEHGRSGVGPACVGSDLRGCRPDVDQDV